MPGFDGTGPMGQGALTGRQMGNCAGARTGFGVGRGLGRGLGRGAGRAGYGRGFAANNFAGYQNQAEPTATNELVSRIEELEQQIANLKRS